MSNWYDAPCIFCGYNGPNYYQPKTHDRNCPFYNSFDREDDLREIFSALRPRLEEAEREITALNDEYKNFRQRVKEILVKK